MGGVHGRSVQSGRAFRRADRRVGCHPAPVPFGYFRSDAPERQGEFSRKQIEKLKRQEVLIQLTREKNFISLKGGDEAKIIYMTDFDNMSDDFLEYHLRVVIEHFKDYLVDNANVLISDVPPKGTLSADGKPWAINWRERNIRWLKDVKSTEAQMDKVFVHLKGDANFVTEFVNDGTTYPILWDVVVAYGRHMGVPNNYEGFWMNGRFSGRGTLTNTGYMKNSFVSCLLYWSNPPIAMRLVFGDRNVYNGGVKYVSTEMIFLMHGWGTLRHNNSKNTTGCWKEGTLLQKINTFNYNTLPNT